MDNYTEIKSGESRSNSTRVHYIYLHLGKAMVPPLPPTPVNCKSLLSSKLSSGFKWPKKGWCTVKKKIHQKKGPSNFFKKIICKRYKLQTGDSEMKQIQKFKYVWMILTWNGKCDTEIRRRFGISKTDFEKLNKVSKKKKKIRQRKEKNAKTLCNTGPAIREWMLEIYLQMQKRLIVT